MEERHRAYFYRIATAIVGLLVVYNVLTGEQAAQWTLFAAAVLGATEGALAIRNTSTKNEGLRRIGAGDYDPPVAPVSTFTPGGTSPWRDRAIAHLVKCGYTEAVATDAIDAYLDGAELTPQQANCIKTVARDGIRV